MLRRFGFGMDPEASPWSIFLVYLRLGVTSFGGPVAHLGYFHEEFVVRRQWLKESDFAEVIALCQFLPGPASSQVGMVIGLHRGGWVGALAAWLGFTLPSALLMTFFAYGMGNNGGLTHAGWLAGLKLAAVAVVAQAVLLMAWKFCRMPVTVLIALAGAIVAVVWPSSLAQVAVIAGGAVCGRLGFGREKQAATPESQTQGGLRVGYGRRTGLILLGIFLMLLVGLPILRVGTASPAVATFDSFYQAGSLVFGGGHVVLPLLQTAVVNPGWVDDNQFLAGYGAAQALPGPLFTFASYLGAIMKPHPNGWVGALWCLGAIYTPAVLLVFGALPFWISLRRQAFAQALLRGTNAAVVGLLLAAFYRPVCTSAVHGWKDVLVALAAGTLLMEWKWPPWLVVALCAGAGEIFLR
jgi:chromate transporter